MEISVVTQNAYIVLSLVSLIINIPLGYVRERTPKFSFKWLFWIHASIPIIIYLRRFYGTSKLFIPVTIFLAIVGQIIGSRISRKFMTQKSIDTLAQIPKDIKIHQPKVKDTQVLVALLNMGGPRTNKDVKDFQQRLFTDPLLIRFPLSFVFQRFFAWILIALRTKAAEERYKMIGGGSPIYKSTTAQAAALRKELTKRGLNVDVIFSFNYSPPFPGDTIYKAQQQGKEYILPLSLYPHFSKATTGSNIFYLNKAGKDAKSVVKFLEAPDYYLHKGYIQSFVDRINEEIRAGESLDDFYLVFSAHGLPLYFLTEGDPYPFQISQTVAQILAKLNRSQDWVISYQSAVGPLQWLKPATDSMLEALIRRGVKKILVVPVSFVGDHIETIGEIDMEYRELAQNWGVEDYRMTKAIETHPGFIQALADCVEGTVENPHSTNEQSRILNSKNKKEVLRG